MARASLHGRLQFVNLLGVRRGSPGGCWSLGVTSIGGVDCSLEEHQCLWYIATLLRGSDPEEVSPHQPRACGLLRERAGCQILKGTTLSACISNKQLVQPPMITRRWEEPWWASSLSQEEGLVEASHLSKPQFRA